MHVEFTWPPLNPVRNLDGPLPSIPPPPPNTFQMNTPLVKSLCHSSITVYMKHSTILHVLISALVTLNGTKYDNFHNFYIQWKYKETGLVGVAVLTLWKGETLNF